MKVLLICYNCAPRTGSEQGIGWNTAAALARSHSVEVVTQDRYRPAIERFMASQADPPDIRFAYVTTALERLRGGRLLQLAYYAWQIKAGFLVRRLCAARRYDVVQHLVWGRCWMPSAALGARRAGVVWGPVGGAECAPPAFLPTLGRSERLRRVVLMIARWDPLVRRLARKADLALATSALSAEYLRRLGARRVDVQTNSGIAAEEVEQLGRRGLPPTPPFRFISMGRLLDWKGFQYGIRAFAEASLPEAEYWIAGSGPYTGRLAETAASCGIADRVRFLGYLSRPETLDALSACHVLVHPSLHDSGGLVCAEAMAAGRPVLCLNLGGPAVQVDRHSGRIIEAHTPEQVVHDIAEAMAYYANHPEAVAADGARGRQRVSGLLTWEQKAQALTEFYRTLTQHAP